MWEYIVVWWVPENKSFQCPSNKEYESVIKNLDDWQMLNTLGCRHWELVSIFREDKTGITGYYFKRNIPEIQPKPEREPIFQLVSSSIKASPPPNP
jgi:hypothetical protein